MIKKRNTRMGAALSTKWNVEDGYEMLRAAALNHLGGVDEKEASKLWGPRCNAVLRLFFNDGEFVYDPSIRLHRNEGGATIGFVVGGLVISYVPRDIPFSLAAARLKGLDLSFAGPEHALSSGDLKCVEMGLYKSIIRAIHESPLVAGLPLRSHRNVGQVLLPAAKRLTAAIVAESWAGAVPRSRSGVLDLLMAYSGRERSDAAVRLLGGCEVQAT